MTFPTGALLLFMGACPAGWAHQPFPDNHEPSPPCTMGETCYFVIQKMPPGAPEGSQWCVKQQEPAHD